MPAGKKLELGSLYRDTQTGFEGVATVETEFVTGCVHYVLEPMGIRDNKPIKGCSFDSQQLELVEKDVLGPVKVEYPRTKLKAKVRARISGLEGVVTARSAILNGKPEVAIQPQRLNADGSPAEGKFFLEGFVEVIEEEKEKEKEKPRGGPTSLVHTPTDDRLR